MASSRRKSDDTPTVKAVLAYAARLRDLADAAKLKDPHCELYRPSNDAARKVSQQHGPEQALVILATRARRAELRYEEGVAAGEEARERHQHLQLVESGERAAERERLSLGQRLDSALLRLQVQSEVPAAAMDSEPVSHGKSEGGPPRSRRDRRRDDLVFDARRAVERLEREADGGARRLVELEAA